ncbi:TonB-dependent receptor [Catalinimonas alkaloidigena]|uniref:TonB-dependent receptor n=1 Tax=Catalinimonas alkaloidigena TaxID=1075417 RepID=UPI001C40999C|nr:TonB-dependent receptor [Catalinimonas alkaloidigena]
MITLFSLATQAQSTGTLQGQVVDAEGHPVEAAAVLLSPSRQRTVTDVAGRFQFPQLPEGDYTLTITHVSFEPLTQEITFRAGSTSRPRFTLTAATTTLQDVEIRGLASGISSLPAQQGTLVFAGKKTEAIALTGTEANLAENNPRQIFAKVPGVMVWEMDGSGNQVGISLRGLNPHRSWELNVRQDGFVTNSDLFGYPESHYNPPMEAVARIELVRGAGALQYGPQFGGMLNYVLKQADTTRPFGFETQQSVGSFGLFSSFNAVGGRVGKLTYYGYYDFRRSDGWRENSDYQFHAWHTSVAYQFSPKVRLSGELSHMAYVNHFAAGLTDAMFEEDPRQSNRGRNYFNPTIYLPALSLAIQATPSTLISVQGSALLGQRNSVQFITLPTVDDTINRDLGHYNPRQVDRDYYHSYASEARVLQRYGLFQREHHLSAGVRYGYSRTVRQQKGVGTSGTDFDLSLTAPYGIDLVFRTQNVALFAENAFHLTNAWTVTPGFRLEHVTTDREGVISGLAANTIPYRLKRQFPLFGLSTDYQLSPSVRAYANVAQNYRPVLYSDLIPATNLDRTDPALQDARGSNSEVGLRGQWQEWLQFDVNYFRLQYNHRVGTLVQTDASGTYFYKTNVGNTLNQGAEVFIEVKPFRTLPLSLFTSTAYNAARYTEGQVVVSDQNVDITGNRIEGVPPWISRNGIRYRHQGLSATVQFSYVGTSYSDALNTEATPTGVNGRVPDYLITDLNATYHFGSHYNVKVSVNNLTNAMYYTRRATGYPGPGILPSDGRSLLVSVGAKW